MATRQVHGIQRRLICIHGRIGFHSWHYRRYRSSFNKVFTVHAVKNMLWIVCSVYCAYRDKFALTVCHCDICIVLFNCFSIAFGCLQRWCIVRPIDSSSVEDWTNQLGKLGFLCISRFVLYPNQMESAVLISWLFVSALSMVTAAFQQSPYCPVSNETGSILCATGRSLLDSDGHQ